MTDSFNFNIFNTISEDDVYQLVTGKMGIRRDSVQFPDYVLTKPDGDDAVAVLASALEPQRLFRIIQTIAPSVIFY